MIRRFTYQSIRDLDAAEVGKMSESEIKDILEKARKKYDVRKKSLKRVEKKTFSPALEKMESYYSEVGRAPVSELSRNRAFNELFNIQAFFRSKTSDVKGAEEVARKQDIQLFGADKIGRAKHRMTTAERTKFWDLYDEFTNYSKTAETAFGYQNIWSEIATIVVEQPYLLDDKLTVMNLLESRLKHEKSERREGFDKDNTAFSGRWDGI